MSRVGKSPISIPQGVAVTFEQGRCRVSGPMGELDQAVHDDMEIRIEDGVLTVHRPSDAPTHRALHGLTRALINNMVEGVTKGFRKSLEIHGTGYRAELRGQHLVLNVGFSHQVEIVPLEGVAFDLETPTLLHVDGIDKQVVGVQAALVRRVRPPEPYKGKGILYQGEQVRRKAGKRA